jgi:hypothetical protein
MTTTLVCPLSIQQGRDFTIAWTWSTGTPVLPVNLTGCTAALMIRQLATDAAPLCSISTTPNAQGAIVLGGQAGTVLVNIYRVATAAFPTGAQGGAAAVSDIWLQWNLDILFPANTSFPAGQLWPFAKGPVSVDASIDH